MDEPDSTDPRIRGATGAHSAPIVAGRYRVERLIARGGMAAVYLAEHMPLRRMVALKILSPPPEGEEPGNFEKRFRLEAETLAGLDHPNIVTLHDYGEAEDGRFFLAMEYIDGPRFTDLLGPGVLTPDRAISLLLQVCAALRYAHKRGVIHRDLKPSNLLIRTDAEGVERLKVVDFGLVKVAEIDQSLTREGLVLGSPHCMAPEQVKGMEVDHRADIYAIGILLFRSLTGAYPFHGASSTATMVAHLHDPIPAFAVVAPNLHVSTRLEDVVRRCLAKAPNDRYPDVTSLITDLSACVGIPADPDSSHSVAVPAEAAPVPAVVPAPQPAADRRGLLLLLALLLLFGVGGAGWYLSQPSGKTAGSPGGTPSVPTALGTPPPNNSAPPVGSGGNAVPDGSTGPGQQSTGVPGSNAGNATTGDPRVDGGTPGTPGGGTAEVPPAAVVTAPPTVTTTPDHPPKKVGDRGPHDGRGSTPTVKVVDSGKKDEKPPPPEGYMGLPDDLK
jgi:serine/threonine protein kinase